MVLLRYRLEKFNRCLVFQVLWQTPSFRMSEEIRSSRDEVRRRLRIYDGPGSLAVSTESNPELQDDCVYLRGTDHTDDHKVSIRYFQDNSKRDVYFNKVRNSLQHWADSWRDWSDNPVVATNKELSKSKTSPRFIDLIKIGD